MEASLIGSVCYAGKSSEVRARCSAKRGPTEADALVYFFAVCDPSVTSNLGAKASLVTHSKRSGSHSPLADVTIKFVRLIFRPIERFLAQWISLSTQPQK